MTSFGRAGIYSLRSSWGLTPSCSRPMHSAVECTFAVKTSSALSTVKPCAFELELESLRDVLHMEGKVCFATRGRMRFTKKCQNNFHVFQVTFACSKCVKCLKLRPAKCLPALADMMAVALQHAFPRAATSSACTRFGGGATHACFFCYIPLSI